MWILSIYKNLDFFFSIYKNFRNSYIDRNRWFYIQSSNQNQAPSQNRTTTNSFYNNQTVWKYSIKRLCITINSNLTLPLFDFLTISKSCPYLTLRLSAPIFLTNNNRVRITSLLASSTFWVLKPSSVFSHKCLEHSTQVLLYNISPSSTNLSRKNSNENLVNQQRCSISRHLYLRCV